MFHWSKLFQKPVPQVRTEQPSNTDYRQILEPEPKLLGILLLSVFLDDRIGLNEREALDLSEIWPLALQKRIVPWTNVYLSWALSKFVADKYGKKFAEDAVTSAISSATQCNSEETRDLLAGVAFLMRYWFPIFDTCLGLPNETDCPPEIKEAPAQFTIAFALLRHGGEHLLPSADEDAAQQAISACLKAALQVKWDMYQRAVEIGSHFEEVP